MRALFSVAAVALLALYAVRQLVGLGSPDLEAFYADWYLFLAFLTCGLAVLARALTGGERAWLALGGGLVLYAAGNVYFNLSDAPAFPSLADALWLALYPLAFVALALLVVRRFCRLNVGIWLDGLVVGSVVAALVAATVFDPIFDVAVAGGAGGIARLAYPLGDLVAMGLVGAVWSIAGRRLQLFWVLLGLGFSVLALADSAYVVQAARGEWILGGPLDLPYTIATMLIAAGAWAAPSGNERPVDAEAPRLMLPVVSGLIGLGLTAYAVLAELNPLATVLSALTLLAVTLRLGSTLARLSRQRGDLAVLAATDPLTGLANHRAIHERLADELARADRVGESLSVVALDVDHFKAFNDTYGHTEGDVALQVIAAELSRQARETDLVGRVGGEEFMLVLPGTSAEEAFAIAERCRSALALLPVQGGGVSCSAGVASHPADDSPGTRLTEFADGALYWAKRSGRAQTRRYDPREVVLLSGAEQRAQVQALLDSPGALTPWFQPIVEVATGRIGGYEALTRFTQTVPVRPPDVWFAQARRCGLGAALEAKAIEVALAVPDRPAGTFLSLNVSPAALVSPEVRRALPGNLTGIVIELTEGEVFSTAQALDAELDRLRARGARIAVDDVGAGYAGLQQLVRVKPDIVKLDRSLITGVDVDESKIALLEALAGFASTTGAAVCGEGIETLAELRALAQLDTTYAQGYALGRPGPAWPDVATPMAAHTSAEVSVGLRLARDATGAAPDPLSVGQVSEALGRVRTGADLGAAVGLMKRLLHADEVVVSRVLHRERGVTALSEHHWFEGDELFSYDDYPTTEHVVTKQVLGQLIEGDPAADAAELKLLLASGFSALLMAPIVFRGETVGLLEIFRATARPWTGAEIDRARILAQSLGPAIPGDLNELPWSPDAIARAQS